MQRNWLKQDDVVKEKLKELYMQGVQEKMDKVSAEVATRMLKDDYLAVLWDQRYMCSVTKVKSFYLSIGTKLKKQTAKNTQANTTIATQQQPSPNNPALAAAVDPPQQQIDINSTVTTTAHTTPNACTNSTTHTPTDTDDTVGVEDDDQLNDGDILEAHDALEQDNIIDIL